VGDEEQEVRQLAVAGIGGGRGDGGRGRLEADGEEDDAAAGLRLGQLQGVERRVDHAHIGALRLGPLEARRAAGHTEHVAECREDDAVEARDLDGGLDHAHGRHTHGAARAAEELDVGREHGADAAAE